jgi:hypothetical protein
VHSELCRVATMTPQHLITETGRALYGERWQTDMARDLGVSDRTVRRWAAGTENPRPGVYADLLRLCLERTAQLSDAAKAIAAFSD